MYDFKEVEVTILELIKYDGVRLVFLLASLQVGLGLDELLVELLVGEGAILSLDGGECRLVLR